MKILILSDNHHRKLDFNFNEFDYILHAGDRGYEEETLLKNNAIYVKGNCDLTGDDEYILNLGNKKILLLHGHTKNVKQSYLSLSLYARSQNVNLVIFGHTHYQDSFIDNDILFINPGAYEDGYYAILDDDNINLYFNDKIMKKIKLNWE